MPHHCSSKARTEAGTTLIEVLVAVLVSSIGLLGVAGLAAASTRTEQAAYEVAQLGLAAQALIDSMHVNPIGVVAGSYNGAFETTTSAPGECSAGCSASQRATDDRARFTRSIAATLPNPDAALQCAANDSAAGSGEVCHLTVAWARRALSPSTTAAAERFAWVFTP